MSDSLPEQFLNKEYIRLETFKKNGRVIPTPVWFVIDDGTIFVRSYANSGKVKRMRNNPPGEDHALRLPGKAPRHDPGREGEARGRRRGDQNQPAPLPQVRADEDVLRPLGGHQAVGLGGIRH